MNSGPARVHAEALHAGRQVMGQQLLLHQALLHRREIIGRRPLLGDVLLAEIDLPGLERLQRHRPVAEILGAPGVEIGQPAHHRQVLRPDVGHALHRQGAAELEMADAIGAGAERRVGQRLVELAPGPPMLRQHRHLAEDQRQFAVACWT